MKNNCVLCGSNEIEVFLKGGRVPVHQHLLLPDPTAAVNVRRGNLEMTVCHRCGFVFNRAFDHTLLDYGVAYDNYQGFSPSFADYMRTLIESLVEKHGVPGSRVVEVGSGNGAFLRALVEAGGETTTGFGFDPAYEGPSTAVDGRVRFMPRFYGPDCANVPADIVVSRHVIEHVPDPVDMLQTIRLALGQSPKAKIFLETPDVTWILRNAVSWDFFYEHCSLFSPASLATAFQLAGFEVDEVRLLFDGQYQWLAGRVGRDTAVFDPGEVPDLARRFGKSDSDRTRRWAELIWRYHAGGRVALWGAGAKAVTFAGIIDPCCELIDCIVDINPHKQGCFLSGTGHPIVAPEALGSREVHTAVLLNPNYRDEVAALLIELSTRTRLIDLMSHET